MDSSARRSLAIGKKIKSHNINIENIEMESRIENLKFELERKRHEGKKRIMQLRLQIATNLKRIDEFPLWTNDETERKIIADLMRENKSLQDRIVLLQRKEERNVQESQTSIKILQHKIETNKKLLLDNQKWIQNDRELNKDNGFAHVYADRPARNTVPTTDDVDRFDAQMAEMLNRLEL